MAWYLPLLIFVARIGDVSAGTVRSVLVVSGYRFAAAALGFLEVIIWVLAVSGVLKHLPDPFVIAGYAGGYAAGVLVGMTIEKHVALGWRIVRIISPDGNLRIAAQLREQGHRVTGVAGEGRSGPVEIAFLVVKRRALTDLQKEIAALAPDAFVTIERVEQTGGGAGASRFARRPQATYGLVRK